MLGSEHKDMQYAGTAARSGREPVPGTGLGLWLWLSSGHNKSTKWLLQLLLLLSLCCCYCCCCCFCCCFHTKLSKSFRIKKLDVRISQKLPPHYIESWFWACCGGEGEDSATGLPHRLPLCRLFSFDCQVTLQLKLLTLLFLLPLWLFLMLLLLLLLFASSVAGSNSN